jgi:hypothetical protein
MLNTTEWGSAAAALMQAGATLTEIRSLSHEELAATAEALRKKPKQARPAREHKVTVKTSPPSGKPGFYDHPYHNLSCACGFMAGGWSEKALRDAHEEHVAELCS